MCDSCGVGEGVTRLGHGLHSTDTARAAELALHQSRERKERKKENAKTWIQGTQQGWGMWDWCGKLVWECVKQRV